MFIGIENHPACFAMLSEGCKRSIMAGTIFRFNTVSPLARLRIIRSLITLKIDKSSYISSYLSFCNLTLQSLYIQMTDEWKSSFVLSIIFPSHPAGVSRLMCIVCPVLSSVIVMEHTKSPSVSEYFLKENKSFCIKP